MIVTMTMAASVALTCQLRTMDNDPPMIVTLNNASNTVQVSMAGQTYLEDTVADGPVVWWQVKSRDGTIIRSRLNRADGTLIITSENSRTKASGQMVEGRCSAAPENPSDGSVKKAQWVKLGDTPKGAMFVDVDSARREGQFITHWIRMILPARTEEGEDYIVVKQSLDCQRMSYRAEAIITYDLSGRMKEREEISPPEQEWVSIPPESTFAALDRLLCKR